LYLSSSAPARRPYRMRKRAAAAAATRARIIAAALDLFMREPVDEISLRDVAAHAGVALQTLVRQMGSREGLIRTVAAALHEQVAARRFAAPVGDVRAAVAILLAHYEANGQRLLRALAQEERLAALHEALEAGRGAHRQWVATVFAPFLPEAPAARRLRLAQLAAVTDVHLWHVLRTDQGLSATEAEAAVVDLVRRLVEEVEEGGRGWRASC